MRLTVYVRSGCGLCEAMLAELQSLLQGREIPIDVIDIDTDPQLQQRFNTLVPVLAEGENLLCQHFLDSELLLAHLSRT